MSTIIMDAFGISSSKTGFGGVVGFSTNVNSGHILNNTILGEDMADGIITEAKLASELLTALGTFTYDLGNLKSPGWYGNFTIKNDNTSNPYTITFSVEAHTPNPVTNIPDVRILLFSTTLAHNQDVVIPVLFHERLLSDETIIKILYTLSNGNIDGTNVTGVDIEGESFDSYELKVQGDFIHNGNIEFEVVIQ